MIHPDSSSAYKGPDFTASNPLYTHFLKVFPCLTSTKGKPLFNIDFINKHHKC